MDKTILVTGGAGFIGSNFVYMLLDERPSWRVVCVDSLTYAANIHTLNEAFKNPRFVPLLRGITCSKLKFHIIAKGIRDIKCNWKYRPPIPTIVWIK